MPEMMVVASQWPLFLFGRSANAHKSPDDGCVTLREKHLLIFANWFNSPRTTSPIRGVCFRLEEVATLVNCSMAGVVPIAMEASADLRQLCSTLPQESALLGAFVFVWQKWRQ